MQLDSDMRRFDVQPGLFHPALRQPPQTGALVTLWIGQGETEVYALSEPDARGGETFYSTNLYQHPAQAQLQAQVVASAFFALSFVSGVAAIFFPQLRRRFALRRHTHAPRLRYMPTYATKQPYER